MYRTKNDASIYINSGLIRDPDVKNYNISSVKSFAPMYCISYGALSSYFSSFAFYVCWTAPLDTKSDMSFVRADDCVFNNMKGFCFRDRRPSFPFTYKTIFDKIRPLVSFQQRFVLLFLSFRRCTCTSVGIYFARTAKQLKKFNLFASKVRIHRVQTENSSTNNCLSILCGRAKSRRREYVSQDFSNVGGLEGHFWQGLQVQNTKK